MKKKNLSIDTIILAAGMGTRMKSAKPKVLHEILGKPMVGYITDAVSIICKEKPVVVIGSGAEQVKAALGDHVRYVAQEPQLGTAHAVMCARELLQGKSESGIGGKFRFSSDHKRNLSGFGRHTPKG